MVYCSSGFEEGGVTPWAAPKALTRSRGQKGWQIGYIALEGKHLSHVFSSDACVSRPYIQA